MPDVTGGSQSRAAKTKAADKKAADDAAKKNKFTQSAEDVEQGIVGRAGVSDPTAASTSTLPPNLTNPTGQYNPTVNIGNTEFGNADYIRYFVGLNGQPPLVKQDVDPKTKQPFIGLTNAQGTLDYVAIIGDPNDPSKFKVTDWGTALNDYKKWIIDSKININDFKKSLYESSTLKASELRQSLANKGLADTTLDKVILKRIQDITNNNYLNVLSGKSNAFSSYSGEQVGPYGLAPGQTRTSTSVSKQLLDNREAAMDLDALAQEYLGRNATDQEVNAYLKSYNDLASKHPTKVTSTTDYLQTEKSRTTVGGITAQDSKAVAIGILSDSLRAAGKNPDSISKLGGTIGRYINSLKQTAGDYGLHYSDSQALDDAIKSIQPGATIQDRQNVLKNLAKIQYKNLASAIDAGVTVRDVANQYNQLNQKYLETMTPVDVMSNDMQKALTGGANGSQMNSSDYIKYLKSKPEWGMTTNAHEEAANYANTVLRQFGLIG